jgi:hypothetical protein
LQLPAIRKSLGKIFPHWIFTLDQPNFLFAPPSLDFLFARNGVPNVAELFQVDHTKDPVASSESGNQPLAMLEHSALQVAGHAGVQVPRTTGENVNSIAPSHFRVWIYSKPRGSRSLTPVRQKQTTGFGMTTLGKRNSNRTHKAAESFRDP